MLKFEQTHLEREIENCCTLPEQIVGNCSWESPETAVWAFLALAKVHGVNEGQLKEAAIEHEAMQPAVAEQSTVFNS